MGAAMAAGRIYQDGERDALAQHCRRQVWLADVHKHARSQHDRVKDRARPPQGDLIRGPAGNKVILRLRQPLLGEYLVLIDVDWTTAHSACSPLTGCCGTGGVCNYWRCSNSSQRA